VKFLDGNEAKTHTVFSAIKNGSVKNPYDRTVLGIGYLGEGKYHVSADSKDSRYYATWENLLARCYYEKLEQKYPTYMNKCTVCDDWHNLQNFGAWYEENYYKVERERMHLDKDILFKNNTVYAPDRCLIVPQRINMIFMSPKRVVDSDLPAGINRSHLVNGYIRFNTQYNGKTVGTYDTLEEAVEKQLVVKRIHIRNVAEEYKNRVPNKVYEALLNW